MRLLTSGNVVINPMINMMHKNSITNNLIRNNR